MLDSVDVGVAINLGIYSGRTVGRTTVYFIRKLLRVGCRLAYAGRVNGEGKAWRLRLRGERAKAGAFAYVGRGQRLEPSLTRERQRLEASLTRGEGHGRARGIFVGVSAQAPAFALFCRERLLPSVKAGGQL